MQQLLPAIREIIYDITGIENITPETDFVRDLALNSFDIVNIVCAFEQRFGLEIATRDIWNLNKVRDVVDYMTARGIVAPVE